MVESVSGRERRKSNLLLRSFYRSSSCLFPSCPMYLSDFYIADSDTVGDHVYHWSGEDGHEHKLCCREPRAGIDVADLTMTATN
jgi:hypothetical protein